MKFGKLLGLASESNPQLASLFLRYKDLKKVLKNIQRASEGATANEGLSEPPSTNLSSPEPEAGGGPAAVRGTKCAGAEGVAPDAPSVAVNGNTEVEEGPATAAAQQHSKVSPASLAWLAEEQQRFIAMLNEDLTNFNSYFIEKEEEAVIRMQALADQVARLPGLSHHQMQVLRAALVDLHGELVLSLHWSLLNFAAVVKIVKKYEKRCCDNSGRSLRSAISRIVMNQPFSSTAIMQQLVRRADELVAQVAAAQAGASPAGGGQQLAAGRSSDDSDLNTAGKHSDASTIKQQQQPPTQQALEAQGSSKPAPSSQAASHQASGQRQSSNQQSEVQQSTSAAAAGAGAERQLSGHSDCTCDVTARVVHQQQYEMAQEMAGLVMDSHILRRTQQALQMWSTLSRTASTPSTVLPASLVEDLQANLERLQRHKLTASPAGPALQPAAGAAGVPTSWPPTTGTSIASGPATAPTGPQEGAHQPGGKRRASGSPEPSGPAKIHAPTPAAAAHA